MPDHRHIVYGDMASRAGDALGRLYSEGQAFVCCGYIGSPPAAGWSWELHIFAVGDPVVAGVKFLSPDRSLAHVCTANIDQLDRLGRAIATTVGLMRRYEQEEANAS